jgi:PhzF family phenazine biosynthesis protein
VQFPIYQVDAFADSVFEGNPAAVVFLEEELEDRILQLVAAENNLSETAFVFQQEGCFRLRWFTPTQEVDLCGHATLAAAHLVFKRRMIQGQSVEFETRSGELVVRKSGDMLCMDFPSRPATRTEVTGEMEGAFGTRPLEAHFSRDLLLLYSSEEEVKSLKPDFGRVAVLDVFAVIATAPGDEVDFVSRFFAPRAGVPEDPVTGSAHCTLIPFWATRLGRKKLHARQISQRGGELYCEHRGDRVTIAGRAVEYLRGMIRLPD